MRRYASLTLLIAFAMTSVGCAGGGGASLFFLLAVLLSMNVALSGCGDDDSTTDSADTVQSDSIAGDSVESDGTANIGLSDSVESDGMEDAEPDVPDKDVPDKDVPDKDVPDKDVPDKDVPDKDVPDKDVPSGDIEECDGTWETMCNEDGEVDQACCPAGMACNFGMTMSICEDGSCVNMPDTCEEEECDGTWGEICNESGQLEKACCPEGMVCNFGMTTVICEDGSCVNMPDICKDK
jgi:hypothetical protein